MELNPIDKLIFDSLQNHETITLSGFGGIDYLNNNLETVHSSRFLPEILKSIITEFPEFTESEKIKFENLGSFFSSSSLFFLENLGDFDLLRKKR